MSDSVAFLFIVVVGRSGQTEEIARFVITRRTELGLTQEQLADRMGTSHSAVSRIESGQHRASVATLERLGQALEVRFVMGFETGPPEAPVRELISR